MKDYITVEKSTLDSLIFFSFGITLTDDTDVIINRVIEKAYTDATNLGAFNTKADHQKAMKAKGVDGNDGSLDIMYKRIDRLLNNDNIDYENWHEYTCDLLLKHYKEHGLEDVFSYGNAQKWVNMSLKYLYIISGISDIYAESFLKDIKAIKRLKSYLHIPIDSYIIDILWDEGIKSLPLKEDINVNRDKKYSVPSEYVKGWSTWNKDEYKKVRASSKMIYQEDDIYYTPIDWEIDRWIKRAKERRKKNIY